MYIKSIGQIIKENYPLSLRLYEGNTINGKIISMEDGKGALKLYDGTIIPAIFVSGNNLEKDTFNRFVIQSFDGETLILRSIDENDSIIRKDSLDNLFQDLNIPADEGKNILISLLKFNLSATDDNIMNLYKNQNFLESAGKMDDAELLSMLKKYISDDINYNSKEFSDAKSIIASLKNVNSDVLSFLMENNMDLSLENMLKALDFINNKSSMNSIMDTINKEIQNKTDTFFNNVLSDQATKILKENPDIFSKLVLEDVVNNDNESLQKHMEMIKAVIKDFESASINSSSNASKSEPSSETQANNTENAAASEDSLVSEKPLAEDGDTVSESDKNTASKVPLDNTDTASESEKSTSAKMPSENAETSSNSSADTAVKSKNPDTAVKVSVAKENEGLNDASISSSKETESDNTANASLSSEGTGTNTEAEVKNNNSGYKMNNGIKSAYINERSPLSVLKEILDKSDTPDNAVDASNNTVKSSPATKEDHVKAQVIMENIIDSSLSKSESKDIISNFLKSQLTECLSTDNTKTAVNTKLLERLVTDSINNNFGHSDKKVTLLSLGELIAKTKENTDIIQNLPRDIQKTLNDNIEILKRLNDNYNIYYFNMYDNSNIFKNSIIIKNKFKNYKYMDSNDIKAYFSVETPVIGNVEGNVYKKYKDLSITLSVDKDYVELFQRNLNKLYDNLTAKGYSVVNLSVEKRNDENQSHSISGFFSDNMFKELDVRV